jgi:hypothetical protein
MGASKEYVCNDCARQRGLMPRLGSSAPIRDGAFRQRKWRKHTEGSDQSPLNGVWCTTDTNTIRAWQDDALADGVLELTPGRSTSVIHVVGHEVGNLYAMGQDVGLADAVQVAHSSNCSASHPFPVKAARLTAARCKYCGRQLVLGKHEPNEGSTAR